MPLLRVISSFETISDDKPDVRSSSISPEQKYCSDCGNVILRRAELCPKCGCRQSEAPQPAFEANFFPQSLSMASSSVDSGKLALLLVGNFFWGGLGNLLLGDSRGWVLGFVTWSVCLLGSFTFFLPLLPYFGFTCYLGYEFFKAQNARVSSATP